MNVNIKNAITDNQATISSQTTINDNRLTLNVTMENHDFSFEGLRVYKATRQLVKDVYVLINKLPAIESFALSSQIRRAVVSVKSNIAEGSGRNHPKNKAHFIDMAYGSLMETYSELETAADYLQTFSDLGFAAAIMHKQNLTRKEFSSLYWIQLIIYACIYIVIAACSPLIARFYDTEVLTVLLPIVLIDLLFMGMGRLYGTLLQKNFEFCTIALRNIISAILSLVVAVVLAAMGTGVYSLIVSTLFHTLMANVWNFIAGQKQMKLQLTMQVKENIPLIKIGLYQTGTQIVDYLASKIDVLLIGRFLNMDVLGVYSLAKELLHKLINIINSIAVSVTTPILAKKQNDQ